MWYRGESVWISTLFASKCQQRCENNKRAAIIKSSGDCCKQYGWETVCNFCPARCIELLIPIHLPLLFRRFDAFFLLKHYLKRTREAHFSLHTKTVARRRGGAMMDCSFRCACQLGIVYSLNEFFKMKRPLWAVKANATLNYTSPRTLYSLNSVFQIKRGDGRRGVGAFGQHAMMSWKIRITDKTLHYSPRCQLQTIIWWSDKLMLTLCSRLWENTPRCAKTLNRFARFKWEMFVLLLSFLSLIESAGLRLKNI